MLSSHFSSSSPSHPRPGFSHPTRVQNEQTQQKQQKKQSPSVFRYDPEARCVHAVESEAMLRISSRVSQSLFAPNLVDRVKWSPHSPQSLLDDSKRTDAHGLFGEEAPGHVALAGRSNVGKSTLINTLFRRKKAARKLAYTSSTPGRTQNLSFMQFGRPKFVCVDFPGYGYAKASKGRRNRWADIMAAYLEGQAETVLRGVFVLVDIRHGLKEVDKSFMEYLENLSVPYHLVFTKADKVKSQHTRDVLSAAGAYLHGQAEDSLLEEYRYASPELLVVSSKDETGVEELRRSMTVALMGCDEVGEEEGEDVQEGREEEQGDDERNGKIL